MSIKLLNKVLLAAPVLLALACSTLTPKSTPAPSQADIEKEEQAVYAFFVSGTPDTALILEETSTGIGSQDLQAVRENIGNSFKDVSDETIESFAARNAQDSLLSPDMDLGADYTLLPLEELAKISSQPNWGELLAEKYPGAHGYTIFSRVGFNNALDQAVVYVGSVAGPLMGSGFYNLMEKKNGEWILKEQVMVWIS